MARTAAAKKQGDAAVWLAPSQLKPWAKNPRKNDEAAVARVAKSIKRFGFGAPIVARAKTKEIIAGHTRWLAAKQLKLDRVPVRMLDVSEKDAHTLAVADNRYTELTEWSDDLAGVLEELGFEDRTFAGFDDSDFAKLKAALQRKGGELEDDAIPEPPADPVTKLGDVWQLGRHRLVCGDSRDPAVVASVLRDAKPFIMVTDPPYGVEYDPEWRKRAGIHDSDRMGVVKNDDEASWLQSYVLFPGSVAYVWHADAHAVEVFNDLQQQSKLLVRAQIIWAKEGLVLSRGAYHWQHEPCWYAVREGATASWVGGRSQSTLWPITRREGSDTTIHSTQKPLECMARPLRNHGGADDHVYDPFLGSGSALIAAEHLERTCFGCELNPAYCDVIVERWQRLTGGSAQRA